MRKDTVKGTLDNRIDKIEKANQEMYEKIEVNNAILACLSDVHNEMFVDEPDDENGE